MRLKLSLSDSILIPIASKLLFKPDIWELFYTIMATPPPLEGFFVAYNKLSKNEIEETGLLALDLI